MSNPYFPNQNQQSMMPNWYPQQNAQPNYTQQMNSQPTTAFSYLQQMPAQMSVIPGRQINSVNEILPREVPMDGSVSLFPQSDNSCVYLKRWTSEGTIQTIRYIPEVPETGTDTAANQSDEILKRITNIEQLLSKRFQPGRRNSDSGRRFNHEQSNNVRSESDKP